MHGLRLHPTVQQRAAPAAADTPIIVFLPPAAQVDIGLPVPAAAVTPIPVCLLPAARVDMLIAALLLLAAAQAAMLIAVFLLPAAALAAIIGRLLLPAADTILLAAPQVAGSNRLYYNN